MPARTRKVTPKASESVVEAKPISVTSIQMQEPKDALAYVEPRVTTLAAEALLLKITSPETEQKAASMLVEVAAAEKVVKEKLETITRPLNEAAKAARSVFKPALDRLGLLDATLRTNIIAYRQMATREAEVKRLASAKLADEAAAKGNHALALEHATAAVTVATPQRVVQASLSVAQGASNIRHAQVSARKRWVFEVTDVKKVPREYLEVNDKAVRAAISSGLRSINGIRIYEEDGLAVGGR